MSGTKPIIIFINDKATNVSEILLNENWSLEQIDPEVLNIYRIIVSGKRTGWVVKVYGQKSRAEKESNSLYKLSEVSGVPRILASGIGTDFSYVIMSEAPGVDLFTYVKKENMSEKECKHIAKKILTVLRDIHACGVIHTDLKPENIIYDFPSDLLNIIDFEDRGTEGYTSPEQLRTKVITPKTDIWSFGVLLHDLVFGYLPFKEDTDIVRMTPKLSSKCTGEFRNFLEYIFQSEKDRPTAQEALLHMWFCV